MFSIKFDFLFKNIVHIIVQNKSRICFENFFTQESCVIFFYFIIRLLEIQKSVMFLK